ncbi:MAG: cytochrome c [Candidatus Brocadiales bacterium]
MGVVNERAFYLLLSTVLLVTTTTAGETEGRLSKETDTPAIKTIMKKLERDTQMFEDALEIGDLEELNQLAQELGHTCCQVCTVVTYGLSESEAKEFKKRAEVFYASIQGLMVFTRQSTLQMVTSHYQEVKESCRACHDLFRK